MAWNDCFSAIVNDNTKVIILGSMPGVRSLEASEYYAHPRNAFWSIIENLLNIDRGANYLLRLQQLNQNGIGLWDVYARCFRQGSLDSSIRTKTSEINDFETMLEHHPSIRSILFNGKSAEQAFLRHYHEAIDEGFLKHHRLIALPSTSPAYAAMSFDRKLLQWQKAINEALK